MWLVVVIYCRWFAFLVKRVIFSVTAHCWFVHYLWTMMFLCGYISPGYWRCIWTLLSASICCFINDSWWWAFQLSPTNAVKCDAFSIGFLQQQQLGVWFPAHECTSSIYFSFEKFSYWCCCNKNFCIEYLLKSLWSRCVTVMCPIHVHIHFCHILWIYNDARVIDVNK